MPTLVSKTIKSSGGDYTTLAAWFTAEVAGKNLVTLDQIQQAIVFTPTLSTTLTISGITTDATHYVEITADPSTRHVGIYDESKSIYIGNAITNCIQIDVNQYARISWMQFINKNVSGVTSRFGINAAGQLPIIENCIFKADTAADPASTIIAIEISNSAVGALIRNCIAFGFNTTGGSTTGFRVTSTAINVKVYNCTAYNCKTGFTLAGTSGQLATAKNCLAVNCTVTYTSGNAAGTHNASDTSGTIPGTFTAPSRTVQFMDAAGGDFRLASTDFGVTAYGIDLSADSFFPFSTDITGATISGAWSCGAFCNPLALTNGVAVITSQIRSTGNATGTGGSPQAFDTLVNWYAAMLPSSVNLTAAGFNQIQRAVVFTPTLDTALTMASVTTDATHYVEITADVSTRHVGIYDETKSAYIGNGVTSLITTATTIADVRISWMQFINKNIAGVQSVSGISSGSSRILVENCIFKQDSALPVGSTARGFNMTGSSSGYMIVKNCIAFDYTASGANTCAFSMATTGNSSYLINCTAHNCTTAFKGLSNACIAINCLASSCPATAFSALSGLSSNNASTSATAPIGVASRTSRTVTFVNAAAGDFRLASGDTGVTGLGMDSPIPVRSMTTADIDVTGTTITGPWSIGASWNAFTTSPTTVTSDIGGGANHYTNLVNWWIAKGTRDLILNNEIQRAVVFTPTLSGTTLNISNVLTDKYRYFEITADPSTRHVGTFDVSKSIYTNTTAINTINIAVRDFHISWMQFSNNVVTGQYRLVSVNSGDAKNILIENCLFKSYGNSTSGSQIAGVYLGSTATDGIVKIVNCVSFGFNSNNANGWGFASPQSTGLTYIYNCTAYSSFIGFNGSAVANIVTAKNCLSVNNFSAQYAQSFNTSLSTNNAGTGAPGLNPYASATPLFVDAANGNFHLQSGDTGATGFGANLSADPVYPFSIDFDGTTIVAPWSIGADWNMYATPAKSFYYMLSQGMR